jgi:hypothetical protein
MHNIKHCKEKQNIIRRNTTKHKLKKNKYIYIYRHTHIHTLIKYIRSPQIYKERTFWLIKFEDELRGAVNSFEFCTENDFVKGCDFENTVNSYSYYKTLSFSFS